MSIFTKGGVLGAVVALTAIMPAAALPIASYDASIEATLSLTDVSVDSGTGDADVDIFGDVLILFDDAFAFGDAAAATGGAGVSPAFFSPLASDPITIDISASGAATGIGFASSDVSADGFVEIINNADNTVKLDFELIYSLAADASVTDALLQAATANARFTVQGQEFNPLLEFDLLADTDFFEPGGTIADIFTFSIFVDPFSTADVSVLADVSGFLTSDLEAPTEIPLPSMAVLFGLGALGLLFKGRLKDKAVG